MERTSPPQAGGWFDDGPWTRYQQWLVFATAVSIILDGIDNQLLPNALPALTREWGQPRSAFTNTLAVGPFGMMLGGLIGGLAGDRLGRRPALLGSVLLFGLLTMAIAFATSIDALSLLRFLAGLGLGGAMPNAATLAAEYVPRRHRPVAVTLTIVCIPLGGAIAGEVAALVIPSQGWRALFLLGGAAPLLLTGVLWFLLPESPAFLSRHPDRWPELARLLRRSGRAAPDEPPPSVATPAAGSSGSMATLFREGLARDTTALWIAFFFGLMVNYVVILLLPALLAGVGFSQPQASRALAMSNYGGVAGAIVGALAVQRVGSRVAMLAMAAGAVVCGGLLAGWRLDPTDAGPLMAMFIVTGACINGVQTTMYALAAHVYPTANRATGVGTAVAVGRVGNVAAAYAGAAAIDRGGPPAYFALWAVLMAVVLAALAAIGRHVPRRRPREPFGGSTMEA